MNDRELLEFAAKAAGICGEHHISPKGSWVFYEPHKPNWNPLTDDGDALRLAVKLRMCVDTVQGADTVQYFYSGLAQVLHSEIDITADDYQAATRRAIVRAAAEIGKAQQ